MISFGGRGKAACGRFGWRKSEGDGSERDGKDGRGESDSRD